MGRSMSIKEKEQLHRFINGNEPNYYINTDGIVYDLDGTGMANFLSTGGFTVLCHYDKVTNGVVELEGFKVSTNGLVYK